MTTDRCALSILALALACSGASEEQDKSGGQADPGGGASDLPLPDISGVDMPTAYRDAVDVVRSLTLSPAWTGNQTALGWRREGCPDVYAGSLDEDMEGAPGISWSDYCTTPGGLNYRGNQYWYGRVQVDGDPASTEGQTVQGGREMVGAGVVSEAGGNRFEFRGTGSDSLYQVDASGYKRWTYGSTVTGTISGGDALDASTHPVPGGFRSDMYLYATGGDVDSLEARGDVYMLEDRIADRFDSVSLDLTFQGELGAGPGECTLEPVGWIGLRDENAWWYDLVFLPLEGDGSADSGYINDDYSACDGCGTLYLRGLEATHEYGEVCVDFSSLFAGDIVALPDASAFVFTLRDYVEESR